MLCVFDGCFSIFVLCCFLCLFGPSWVFTAVGLLCSCGGRGPLLALQFRGFSCGSWAVGRMGLSSCCERAQWSQTEGTWSSGSVVGVHGLGCFTACGTFPDLGCFRCLQHWWADSFLLHCQESPRAVLITALQYGLKSGSVTPLLLLLSQDCFGYVGFVCVCVYVCFHKEFKVFCFSSVAAVCIR